MTRIIIRFALLLIVFSFLCCKEQDAPVGSQSETDRQSTLSSLTKINDYPFYTMTFFGDYGFREYLRTGGWPPMASLQSEDNLYSCTCFAAMGSDSGPIYGRNFDWTTHIALLLYTHPSDGYASVSMVHLSLLGYSEGNPPDLSQNKELLFSSPYWPLDGMNECGVSIATMAVDKVAPPYDPTKTTISSLAAIRLVLDYAKDVNEAVKLIANYNIVFASNPLHLLIADSTGHSAIIEFIDDELKVIENISNWQVCMNFIVYGTQAPNNVSCWRYNKAYSILTQQQGSITPTVAMDILKQVSQGPTYNTMWSNVYEPKTLGVDIVINRQYTDVYHFYFDSFTLH